LGWPTGFRDLTLGASRGDGMLRGLLRRDDGMATAEYALVTVAAAAFAGVLIALVKSQTVRDLLADIFTSALGR
jgi:hypothetical protein